LGRRQGMIESASWYFVEEKNFLLLPGRMTCSVLTDRSWLYTVRNATRIPCGAKGTSRFWFKRNSFHITFHPFPPFLYSSLFLYLALWNSILRKNNLETTTTHLVCTIPPQKSNSKCIKRQRLSDTGIKGYIVPLPPRKYSWYSLPLEAESTPGPQCSQKDYVNEKFQSNPRPSGL